MFYLKKDATWYLLATGRILSFPYYIYTRPGPRSQNTTPTVEKSLSYACYCQATFTLVQVLMGKFVPALTKVEFWILDRTWLNGTPLLYRYECQAVTGLQILTAWLIIYPHLFMDDGVVVMGDEAAARSSLERTVCRGGHLVDQKGAEHDESLVDEETLPASRGSVDLFGDYFNTKGLHFVHLNIRSLLPKIDEIRCLLKNCKVGIFCLTETWLDSSVTNNEIKVDIYNVIRKDRNRQGGGVCIFIRSDINFNVLDINVEQELLFLDLLLPATKPILFGVCYRPPSQNNFYEGLEFVLNNNNDDLAKECIIMGDFNTNISNKTGDNFKALQSLWQLFHLTQIINKSTRVWEGGESTIDLILVSDEKYISQKGVIEYGISDHNIIFCTRKRSKIKFSNHKTVRIRSLKNIILK